jgi:hypothetical protein
MYLKTVLTGYRLNGSLLPDVTIYTPIIVAGVVDSACATASLDAMDRCMSIAGTKHVDWTMTSNNGVLTYTPAAGCNIGGVGSQCKIVRTVVLD